MNETRFFKQFHCAGRTHSIAHLEQYISCIFLNIYLCFDAVVISCDNVYFEMLPQIHSVIVFFRFVEDQINTKEKTSLRRARLILCLFVWRVQWYRRISHQSKSDLSKCSGNGN